MKKRLLTEAAAVAVALTSLTAYAASNSVVMYGDTAQRTHVSTISDPYPWMPEATLTNAKDPNTGLTINNLASASTAIGAGGVMFYPVSVGSIGNNYQGINGYMIAFDVSKWTGGKPAVIGINQIPNVSNSSPVYDPNTGAAYLAAGTKFYTFTISGGRLSNTSVSIGGAGTSNYNQVVSYPLYVTAAQAGTPTDEIWVSTQNGWLYSINPSTMQVIGSVNIGQRMDASPALVTASDGTKYIAVTGADDPNGHNANYGGKSGVGMLFLVNPITGNYKYLANPYGAISSTASPVATSTGIIMWNDGEGNVFVGKIAPDGTVSILQQHPNVGDGQTSWDGESAYAENQYIEPFTDGGTYGYATINPATGAGKQYASSGQSGQLAPVGSPEISANGNMYIADAVGGIDEIQPNPQNGNLYDGTKGGWLPSFGSSEGTPLSTAAEINVGSKLNKTEPTLTLATNQGLELWINAGEYLTFETQANTGSYTSSSSTQFSQSLKLAVGTGNLPTDSGNHDVIAFDLSVNGGTQKDDVGAVGTYDAAGNPLTGSIAVSQNDLNTWLANYDKQYPSAWNTSAQNNVVVTAYAHTSTDVENYVFQGSTAERGGQAAFVTVNFPAPSASTPTAPGNPPIGCVENGNVACSSALPGYTEWRFLSPGMLGVLEGKSYPAVHSNGTNYTGGTAWKIHPITEQAITSKAAAQTTTYYSSQRNPGGINDSQTANWWNNFTIEFVNSAKTSASFNLNGTLKTTGDMLYSKRYISSWTPHWSEACSLYGCWWIWEGYTPNYSTEYLYRNVSVTETESASLNVPLGQTAWWNPSTVNVTASGSFGSGETPITPAGSSMSWSQPVWAAYGGWVSSVNGNRSSEVGITSGLGGTTGLTANSMLPGTPTDGTPANVPAPSALNGVWYSDAPIPPIPAGGDTSPQGAPTSHPFDAEHNGGVLMQPSVSASDYPQLGAGEWYVMPTYTITSGSGTFEHPQISTWIPTWSKPWAGSSGQGVVTSTKSTINWNS